mmetsp:Transcript_22641/g.37856  ORF Transcript_22641/g.37856 Transcript_22641/m.37856 type:complete len:82 (+) Transcript_22641:314-559(+)|eukprot:CAMPEP_0198210490 /NCGR_PEP_ID=MMETSP1445-20131203/20137_1 /TAXON_ID=36898 /ORGANISM="Pyramimonas sp., Strain CCMP2087" /LENGTH=81 /DNA_ID=CAMNT_0043884561 /DNA_START=291 /DNA_END=536 /DNA_ORIENTATION=-
MKLNVLFFAKAREIVGQPRIELVLADDADTTSMLSAVMEQFPQLAAMLDKIVIAVNQEYLQGTMALKDGDEIAFIPPISGG